MHYDVWSLEVKLKGWGIKKKGVIRGVWYKIYLVLCYFSFYLLLDISKIYKNICGDYGPKEQVGHWTRPRTPAHPRSQRDSSNPYSDIIGAKKTCPRRNFSLDTKNPKRKDILATKAHHLNTWKGRKHKISKQKLPLPHWMHYSYFPGRIKVEKTPEQCYLGYRNSQRTERGVWWDRCSSGGLDDQQV